MSNKEKIKTLIGQLSTLAGDNTFFITIAYEKEEGGTGFLAAGNMNTDSVRTVLGRFDNKETLRKRLSLQNEVQMQR